jgi:hypothetical protein
MLMIESVVNEAISVAERLSLPESAIITSLTGNEEADKLWRRDSSLCLRL